MPFVEEAFRNLGDPVVIEGRDIGPDHVRDAEILALRSTTKVDKRLLAGSKVRFVGTATIGTDHMDIPYMEEHGIHWCFAPGCNANSVSEYFTTALLCLASRHGFTIEGKTLGVVGVGNVGKRVAAKGEALGMRVLRNDPPRERNGDRLPGETFVSLEQVLAESDVLTFHVPLTKTGPDKTLGLANAGFLERLKPSCILFNAARGPVLATDALLRSMDTGKVPHCVIDTWEGEPDYRTDLLARVDLGSPHIAGHSFEGKVMGTVMVFEEACRFLGIKCDWDVEPLLPPPVVPEIRLDVTGRKDESVLWELVHRVYDIEGDDARFRATAKLPDEKRIRQFDLLRSNYPVRREFRFTRVELTGASPSLVKKVSGLGFTTA